MRPDPYKQKASRRYQAAHKSAQKKNAAEQPPSTAEKAEPKASQHQGKYSHRKIQDNSWRYELSESDDAPLDSLEAAEAREDEYVREFLAHLEEKSQRASSNQSAAYFQLRDEAAFADLDTYNEKVWNSLLDVDWDGLVDVAASTPLRKLIGASDNAVVPEGILNTLANATRTSLPPCSQQKPARQTNPPGISSFKLNAADLAPGISSNKPAARQDAPLLAGAKPEVPKQQPPVTKPSVSAQHLSATTAPVPSSAAPKPQKSTQSVDELEAFLDEIL
ncbi:hypothetical protein LPJ55_003336 [Coemansia sp. RSA 990]|nr:hypothetical protein BX667DRAFT_495124 [Coemansia mojavensis]KAJ1741788.1 hypothetical protein LPJ68_002518 [Coemansia sp. RSA 1086]KAJ1872165.1 hypothetical protein LPJ55_003336 [Coemansia sp. RSA 990]